MEKEQQVQRGNTTLFQALNEFCPDPINNLKVIDKMQSQRMQSNQTNLDNLIKNSELMKKGSVSAHREVSQQQRIKLPKHKGLQRKGVLKSGSLIMTHRKSDHKGKMKINVFKKAFNSFSKTRQMQGASKSEYRESQAMVKITQIKNTLLTTKNTITSNKDLKIASNKELSIASNTELSTKK